MATRMTRAQHVRFMDWMERMKSEKGHSAEDVVRIFNEMPVQEQQFIIRREWYKDEEDPDPNSNPRRFVTLGIPTIKVPIRRPLIGGRIEFKTA